MTVFASMTGDNADLIVACHELGYINDDDWVLDPTYGQGRWWRKYRPAHLVASDITTGTDFRKLPHPNATFDVVAFDPPYKLNGTGGSHPSDDDYGVAGPYQHWRDKHLLMIDGVLQCKRVLKPGGVLLVKCQDQVSSGEVRWQTFMFHDLLVGAQPRNFDLIDMLHLQGHRPQPGGRRQIHARRNYSTLMVFRKKKW